MKLFTKEINSKLFKQYSMGSNLEKQVAVAKIFNPYGDGRWFLLNSDPNDPDYIWAIVQMHGEVEMGSVSRRELETLKVGRWKLPLERDLGFQPVNADRLMEGLREGKFYKDGGWVEYAQGGVVMWQDAQIGDSARVIAENKTGLIMQAYGRKFHLRFVDGSEKTYDAKELEFFKDEEEDEFAKGGVLSVGQKFGDWSVTQYKPVVFEEIGGTRGGIVKLVNQDTLDVILIQYDGALRNAKWFARNKGVRIEGKNPKEVIEKLKLQSFAKGGELPNVGDTIPVKDIDYEMMEYLDRTNKKLLVTMKNGEKVKSSVGKFQNDIIFHGNFPSEIKYSHYSIQKKHFDKIEIVDENEEFEERGVMSNGGGIPKVGDDVRGFNHKYGTSIKEVDEKGKRFKIKQSDYWDSGDTWISFDDVVVDEEDDSTWRRKKMAKGGMTAKDRLKKSLKKVK